MYKKIVYTGSKTPDEMFNVIMEDNSIKGAGPNLSGMIRYTYFEDYSYPPEGWEILREQLIKDYQAKVMPDILSGKIKTGKHNF